VYGSANPVQCDGARPACDRCGRSGRQCSGYRDLTKVMFHDENQRIIDRASQKYAKSGSAAAKRAIGKDSSTVAGGYADRSEQSTCESTMLMLGPSKRIGQDEAICLFRREYSFQSASVHFGHWTNNPAVFDAITAIGLSLHSFNRRSPCLSRAGFEKYASALQSLNGALSHRATAVADATLVAVSLLAYFEVGNFSRDGDLHL
jgi:hypothetical protein